MPSYIDEQVGLVENVQGLHPECWIRNYVIECFKKEPLGTGT